jgi:DNA gyrase subunit A
MGVKTIGLTEKKGGLAGALIVREHHDLVFISQQGMVQRTGVKGISKQGRPAQGVRVMNLREDDTVSAVALVMETSQDTSAEVQADLIEADVEPEVTQAPEPSEDEAAEE